LSLSKIQKEDQCNKKTGLRNGDGRLMKQQSFILIKATGIHDQSEALARNVTAALHKRKVVDRPFDHSKGIQFSAQNEIFMKNSHFQQISTSWKIR
jgi:hypothetical protein